MSEILSPDPMPGRPTPVPAFPDGPGGKGMSDIARLVDTLVAPSRTFADILLSSRWWLPFVLGALVTYAFFFAVQRQVGWPQVVENTLKQTPKQQERFAGLESTQAAEARQRMAGGYQYFAYAAPAVNLVIAALCAAVLLVTINFGFGGEATFGRLFAVWMYATLPLTIKYVLATAVLFAGMQPEQFDLQNPVGTNLGYYLPADFSRGFLKLAASMDVATLWSVVLLTIGCAIVGKVKTSSAAIAVVGWWALIVLGGTAVAIVNS